MPLSRRVFLAGLAAAAALPSAARPSAVRAGPPPLRLRNAHTGELYEGEPFRAGTPAAGEFAAIARLMRDHRTGEAHPIDARLVALMTDLAAALATPAAFLILSGYRSPETNAMLARASRLVARNSFHMRGMAVDIRLPGPGAAEIAEAALALGRGGVGFYPDGGFVHLDSGPVRHWSAPAASDLPQPLIASLGLAPAPPPPPSGPADIPGAIAAPAPSVGGLAIAPQGGGPSLGGLPLGGGAEIGSSWP